MNWAILNSWQENGKLSMINQMQTIMYEIRLFIMRKY